MAKSLKTNNRNGKNSFQRVEYSWNYQNWWPGKRGIEVEIFALLSKFGSAQTSMQTAIKRPGVLAYLRHAALNPTDP
jgi:hypothetical protein